VSVAFAYALWEMTGFNPSSQLMPSLALLPGLPLALWLLVRAIRDHRPPAGDAEFKEPAILFALIGYAVAIWAIGFSIPTVALLAWMLFARARMRLVPGLIYGAIVFAVVLLLFDILRGDAPTGVLTGFS
jgi:putative tricarboxylic transport membrane protein